MSSQPGTPDRSGARRRTRPLTSPNAVAHVVPIVFKERIASATLDFDESTVQTALEQVVDVSPSNLEAGTSRKVGSSPWGESRPSPVTKPLAAQEFAATDRPSDGASPVRG